jgi:general secretion pathway protein B
MSYILDALRRADSERERGAIPSLHAKPVPAALADSDDEGEGRRPQPLLWAVIALSVLLVVVLVWLFLGRGGEPQVAPAPVALTTPPAPVVAEPPPPLPPTPAPEPATPLIDPKPPVLPPPVQGPQSAQAPNSATKPQAPASVPDERPAVAFNDLPDNIRRELPQLVIGGAMYSQTPANRMLILNGQVFREGDKVAGQLVLEQIKLKSAVLAYKGYRYNINY